MAALIGHYDNTPFWVPVGTNKDDLECPIQLKVRFTDGTLDVRLWRVSDSTIRRGPEGAAGKWAGGPSPPPCEQLTRCFSAVAELLVLAVVRCSSLIRFLVRYALAYFKPRTLWTWDISDPGHFGPQTFRTQDWSVQRYFRPRMLCIQHFRPRTEVSGDISDPEHFGPETSQTQDWSVPRYFRPRTLDPRHFRPRTEVSWDILHPGHFGPETFQTQDWSVPRYFRPRTLWTRDISDPGLKCREIFQTQDTLDPRHFRPRTEVFWDTGSEMSRHFGPLFLVPKCLGSIVSG